VGGGAPQRPPGAARGDPALAACNAGRTPPGRNAQSLRRGIGRVEVVERGPAPAFGGAGRGSGLRAPGLFADRRRPAARAVAAAEPALPTGGGSDRLRGAKRGPLAAPP